MKVMCLKIRDVSGNNQWEVNICNWIKSRLNFVYFKSMNEWINQSINQSICIRNKGVELLPFSMKISGSNTCIQKHFKTRFKVDCWLWLHRLSSTAPSVGEGDTANPQRNRKSNNNNNNNIFYSLDSVLKHTATLLHCFDIQYFYDVIFLIVILINYWLLLDFLFQLFCCHVWDSQFIMINHE